MADAKATDTKEVPVVHIQITDDLINKFNARREILYQQMFSDKERKHIDLLDRLMLARTDKDMKDAKAALEDFESKHLNATKL
jgi:hypothetical protein